MKRPRKKQQSIREGKAFLKKKPKKKKKRWPDARYKPSPLLKWTTGRGKTHAQYRSCHLAALFTQSLNATHKERKKQQPSENSRLKGKVQDITIRRKKKKQRKKRLRVSLISRGGAGSGERRIKTSRGKGGKGVTPSYFSRWPEQIKKTQL